MALQDEISSSALITIGMPVYNGSKYIASALESLLKQSFKKFIILVSDNASTDHTENIVTQYSRKDSRIHYIRQKENIGALRNFEFVLHQAQTKYFMWAASDDLWSPDWLETKIEILESSQKILMAFGKIQTIDALGNEIPHPALSIDLNFTGSKMLRRLRYYLMPELYGKANPFYSLYPTELAKSIRLNQCFLDYHIIFKVLQRAEIIICPKSIFYKRIHQTNLGSAPVAKSSILKKIAGPFMSWSLYHGYWANSCLQYKLILLLITPIKILYTYYATILSHLKTRLEYKILPFDGPSQK